MDREDISLIIDKICQSPQFEKSTTNQALLKFLVDSTLSKSVPKEYTIAKEVFGKDASDSFNVRVYISNLRKKLDEYYQNEGSADKLFIQIPQGQYSVEFLDKTSFSAKYKSLNIKKALSNKWLFLLLGVALTLSVTMLTRHNETNSNLLTKSKVWSGFLNGTKPCYIALGDHYFFTGNFFDTDASLFMRMPIVNSDTDFDEFIQEHPDYENIFSKNQRTYLSPQSVSCLHNVLPIFCNNGIETELRLSSTLSWSDLPDHNFLFIGSYRAIGIFNEFLNKAGLHFDNKTSVLEFNSADSTYEYHFGKNYLLEDDYVSVLRISTETGKEVLFFLSSFEIGNDAVTKYFTDELLLADFEKEIPTDNSKCFKALFKVSGIYTTAFKTELLHIDPIKNKELQKWP